MQLVTVLEITNKTNARKVEVNSDRTCAPQDAAQYSAQGPRLQPKQMQDSLK